jgi:hypothetical protein
MKLANIKKHLHEQPIAIINGNEIKSYMGVYAYKWRQYYIVNGVHCFGHFMGAKGFALKNKNNEKTNSTPNP